MFGGLWGMIWLSILAMLVGLFLIIGSAIGIIHNDIASPGTLLGLGIAFIVLSIRPIYKQLKNKRPKEIVKSAKE
jgi:hypothetical protein